MDYTKLVDQFRELARDILRMRWISNIKDEILGLDNAISNFSQSNDGLTKDIARANYRLSKLEEANPDFKELKEMEEENIKTCNTKIEANNKQIADYQKNKAELDTKIAKVTSGELKVNADNLSAKAKELAEEYMKVQAGKIKA